MDRYHIHYLPLEGKTLAINPSTGAWLLLGEAGVELVRALSRGEDLEELLQAHPDWEAETAADTAQTLEERDFTSTRDTGSAHSCQLCSQGHMPRLAVLNLTERCNMKCSYCYVDAGPQRPGAMALETARRIVDELLALNTALPVNLTLHGGEPLLCPELIRDLARYTAPHREQLKLSIQTNGTLLTPELVTLLKEHDFSVGISLDGPQAFHDAARPLRGGEGSFPQVMRGIKLLREGGMEFGVITVLTKHNAAHIDELIDFFLDLGIYHLSFSPMQRIGRGAEDSGSFLSGEEIFRAYQKILERVVRHNASPEARCFLQERTLKYLARSIFANLHDFMCMRAPCGAGHDILGFGSDGDYYLCDDFIGDVDFRIGNIFEGSLRDTLITSPLLREKGMRTMHSLPRCRDCDWRSLCGGICYSMDHYSGADGAAETEMCVFYQKMIPYLIWQYHENPELPGLLDLELRRGTGRKLVLPLAHGPGGEPLLSPALFADLLELHSVGVRDTVYLAPEAETGAEELRRFQALVRKRHAACILALGGTDLANRWPLLLSAEPETILLDLNPCSSLSDGIAEAAACLQNRPSHKAMAVFLRLPLDPARMRPELLLPLQALLTERDLLLLEAKVEDRRDLPQVNALLSALRGLKFQAPMRLLGLHRRELARENLRFPLEEEGEILLLDSGHLAGCTLPRLPNFT